MRRELYVQAFRYALVGCIATALDFGTLILLIRGLNVHYLIANALSFTVGLATNYILSIRWVFTSRVVHSRTVEFIVFAAVGIGGLGISEGCMYLGVGVFGLRTELAKLITVFCTLVWNFGLRKALLFRDRKEGECT